MAQKKKNKMRSKAKSTTKSAEHVAKAKNSRKPEQKGPAHKKPPSRARASNRKKKPSVSAESELKRELQSRNRTAAGMVSPRRSQDFEGLLRTEDVDSQSVGELVEEGNLFEAGAVAGVEEADNSDEREVHTHEVPEDDVPKEYQDKD